MDLKNKQNEHVIPRETGRRRRRKIIKHTKFKGEIFSRMVSEGK
jgi:hypothetical protein